jgi:hypothetical protein
MPETKLTDNNEDLVTTALRLTASMADQENVLALISQGLSLCYKVLGCERGLLIAENAEGKREIIGHAGSGDKTDAYSATAVRLVREKNEPLLISDTVGEATLSVQDSIVAQDIRSILCGRLNLSEGISVLRQPHQGAPSVARRPGKIPAALFAYGRPGPKIRTFG